MTPLEVTSTGPGKCGCCMTPYGTGARLVHEHGKRVLVDHSVPWEPPAPRRRRDYFEPGAMPPRAS